MSSWSTCSLVRTSQLHGGVLRRAVLGCTFAAAMLIITGCNTVEGAGKDVKAAGSGIENAADKAKN